MKTVIYIGNFFFPLGNAAGKRVYSNGKLLQELGYNVIFIGQDNQLTKSYSLKDTEKTYDGFYHYAYSYPRSEIEWIKYRKAFKLFKNFINECNLIQDLEFVIIYGSPRISLFNYLLVKFLKKKKIKTISDSVDWLTTKTNNYIFNIVKTLHYNYQNMFINKRVDGVITISKFLESYYKKAGKKTVLIPPLSPVKLNAFEYNNDLRCVFVYAGIPFRKGQVIYDLKILKDRVDITIKLLYDVKEKGADFIFNIFGFTKDEYLHSVPSQKKYVDGLGDYINFIGLRPNDVVTSEISKADFTILIRDVNRDTSAGFPTKISESISCGTPVITTKTSDLEDYIIEGENGFFIDIDNYNEAVDKVMNIILQKDYIINMKKRCIELGTFDYKKYGDRLRCFLDEL